jgi:hypothetical protein
MRRSLVFSCLASSTQQMNSLRAKGVMSFQASSAVPFAISALRRSDGKSWTTPPGTRWPAMAPVYCDTQPVTPRTLIAKTSVSPFRIPALGWPSG